MIHIITALQKSDRGIGYENDLLYHIAHDMKRFRELTRESVVIMGRKTWESLPEKFRPLPHRINIVISRNDSYHAEGALLASSLADALSQASSHHKEIFIIGGASIYSEALPFADTLHLTRIEGSRKADTFFPEYEHLFSKIVSQENHITDDGIAYEFVTLVKN